MLREADMRDYQQRGVTRLYESDGVQAVVPMGGGKTVMAMTAVKELIHDGVIRCALVLAPQRVAKNVWPTEQYGWEHLHGALRVVVVSGDEKERLAALDQTADIYSVPLHFIPWLIDHLKKLPTDHKLFDLLVIDESSKLKGPRGKWGGKLLSIGSRWKIKWWLTGTPRPNGYEDQFKPLAILSNGKAWGTKLFDVWREKHFMRKDYHGFEWEVRPEHETRLIKKIAAYTFAVDPKDIVRKEPVSVFHWVDLPFDAQAQYKAMEKDMVAKFGGEAAVIAANRGIATGKLCQIAQGFIYDEGKAIALHPAKHDQLVELVEELNGDPTLLVYGFVEDLRVVHELYPGMPYLGGGVSDRDADRAIADWNSRKLPLFGLHPASAAHGLNLHFGGNQMIVLDMPWSPELYDQTVNRLRPSLQEKAVFVHHILAKNTIDEVKYARVVDRLSEQEAFRRYLEKV